jgi:type IV fimbrial biogenesis protein FimT
MSRRIFRQNGFRARGFTLVELGVTMVVAAILLMIAIPNFITLINSHRLLTAANDIVSELTQARMEAIKINSYTQFCGNTAATNTTDTLGTACGTQVGAVYEQLISNGVASASSVLAPTQDLVNTNIQVVTGNAIRYDGMGLGYAPGTSGAYTGVVVELCSTNLSSNNHIQVQMAGGSIVTTQTPTTGACP